MTGPIFYPRGLRCTLTARLMGALIQPLILMAGFPSTFADTVRGTWAQNVGSITLTQAGGAAKTGTWNGVTLAFPYEGESGPLALMYTKTP